MKQLPNHPPSSSSSRTIKQRRQEEARKKRQDAKMAIAGKKKFEFNEEDDREGGFGLPFKCLFYARNVCALLGPMSRSADTGTNIVDRGHLLVQRELSTDYLRIAMFHRDATNEHEEPALVSSWVHRSVAFGPGLRKDEQERRSHGTHPPLHTLLHHP